MIEENLEKSEKRLEQFRDLFLVRCTLLKFVILILVFRFLSLCIGLVKTSVHVLLKKLRHTCFFSLSYIMVCISVDCVQYQCKCWTYHRSTNMHWSSATIIRSSQCNSIVYIRNMLPQFSFKLPNSVPS